MTCKFQWLTVHDKLCDDGSLAAQASLQVVCVATKYGVEEEKSWHDVPLALDTVLLLQDVMTGFFRKGHT